MRVRVRVRHGRYEHLLARLEVCAAHEAEEADRARRLRVALDDGGRGDVLHAVGQHLDAGRARVRVRVRVRARARASVRSRSRLGFGLGLGVGVAPRGASCAR